MFQDKEGAIGDFILVELELEEGRNIGQKIHFVSKIEKILKGENSYEVIYVRLSTKSGSNDTFVFPHVEDRGSVSKDKVIGVLKDPMKGETKRLSNIIRFNRSFSNYNIH